MLPVTRHEIHPVSGKELPSPLCGVLAPLFTPERLDGRIDFDGLEAQADYLCKKSEVSAIIVRSGEGRMWSYSMSEVRDAINCVLSVAHNRKPVIAGAAGIWDRNTTDPVRPAVYFRKATDLSQWALAAGAVAVLQPVPVMLNGGYDYGPQDVILRFFEDLAKTVNGPIIIYNPPDLPRDYQLLPSSISRLSRLSQIVGIIYWTRDSSTLGEIVRLSSENFAVSTGCDAIFPSAMMVGASSSSGTLSTLVPEIVSATWNALKEKDLAFAWRAQMDLMKVAELISPWTAGDIGCALLARQGLNMASRSRDGGRPPLPNETDMVVNQINYLRAAYL